MRPVLSLFFFCGFLSLGVAEEDYRAHLEKASEVMATATMHYTRTVRMGMSGKRGELSYDVIQEMQPHGTLFRREELMHEGRLLRRESLRGIQEIQRIYYTDQGESIVFISAKSVRTICTPDPVRKLTFTSESQFSGREITYAGVPCWEIHHTLKWQGKSLPRDYIVEKESHVIRRERLLEEDGRMLCETTYGNFSFAPQVSPDLFQPPAPDVLFFARTPEELGEAYRGVTEARTQDFLSEKKRNLPRPVVKGGSGISAFLRGRWVLAAGSLLCLVTAVVLRGLCQKKKQHP
ncbi:MAG: hypothetical protein ACI4SG_05015 [Oligosphaeraceae bacterium]